MVRPAEEKPKAEEDRRDFENDRAPNVCIGRGFTGTVFFLSCPTTLSIILLYSHFAEEKTEDGQRKELAQLASGRAQNCPTWSQAHFSPSQPGEQRFKTATKRADFFGISMTLNHISGWGREDEHVRYFIQRHTETFPRVKAPHVSESSEDRFHPAPLRFAEASSGESEKYEWEGMGHVHVVRPAVSTSWQLWKPESCPPPGTGRQALFCLMVTFREMVSRSLRETRLSCGRRIYISQAEEGS